MTHLRKVLLFLGLLVSCASETASDERVRAPEPPRLVAQRVTATVKREASRLVQIQTEHEALLTTPEHPFATPHAGWIPAGRLVPGDRVVSARFGAVRVLSVEKERPAEPELVFNLSVDPSHAYVVGTDQVLVHNTRCKTPAETAKELEEAEDKLEDLQLKLLLSPEEKSTLEPQIAETKKQIATLKSRMNSSRARQKKARAGSKPSGPEPEVALDSAPRRRDPIGRNTRALQAVESAIRELEGTSGSSPSRLQALKRERARLMNNLRVVRNTDRRKRGIAAEGLREPLLREAEADFKSRSEALAAAQRELDELLGEEPQSDAEQKSQAKHRATLGERIKALRLERDASEEILAGERRIAKLAERSPSTDAERAQIAAERQHLSAMLSKKRHARSVRHGRQRDDDEVREKRLRVAREAWHKKLRTPAYVANKDRPRDTLELLEEELEARRQGPRSENLDEQTEFLAERIATMKELVEVAREHTRLYTPTTRARAKRRKLLGAGEDTREVDETIAGLLQKRSANKTREAQLALREKVLANLDGTTRPDASDEVNEARLRELERELERDLAGGGVLPEERLREIQHELVEAELIDAEFLDEIWREAEAEEAALQEAVQDEAEDVDALLRALAESLEKSPSPERTAALESGLQALQNELRGERGAVEAADFALANEHASLIQTLGQPGSSQHAASAQRIAEVQQQRIQLRIDWRERMQRRLEAARQELRDLQSVPGLRDETLEAEVARKIALLEHEVNSPAF